MKEGIRPGLRLGDVLGREKGRISCPCRHLIPHSQMCGDANLRTLPKLHISTRNRNPIPIIRQKWGSKPQSHATPLKNIFKFKYLGGFYEKSRGLSRGEDFCTLARFLVDLPPGVALTPPNSPAGDLRKGRISSDLSSGRGGVTPPWRVFLF